MKKIYIVLGFMLLSGALTLCLGTLNVLNSSYPLWLKIFDASAGITLLLVTLLFIWIEFKANKKNLVETNTAEGSKLMEKKQAARELETQAQILGLPNPLIFIIPLLYCLYNVCLVRRIHGRTLMLRRSPISG